MAANAWRWSGYPILYFGGMYLAIVAAGGQPYAATVFWWWGVATIVIGLGSLWIWHKDEIKELFELF